MNTHQNHQYAVIMAGGVGTRLWPLSRKKKPKQFQSFVSEKTLIQETFDRIGPLVSPDRVFVSTQRAYVPLVEEQLPDIQSDNLILEPEPKNTAPAMMLLATILAHRDPEAIVAVIASDHTVENPDEFLATFSAAFAALETYPDRLITVGINPTRPDTNYGYIKMGDEIPEHFNGKRLFTIEHFKEKPDRETAEEYLTSWEYLWNAGYFVFRATEVLRWLETYSPGLFVASQKISTALRDGTYSESFLADIFLSLTAEPIDTVLAEKLPAEKKLVIPSALKWSDVGGWHTLYEFLTEKHSKSEITRGHHVDLGSKNCLIYGEKRLIATAGLKDIVIVDTDDAILVADRDSLSRDAKKLIEKLSEEKR